MERFSVYCNCGFSATTPGVLQEAAGRAPTAAPPAAAAHWQTEQRGV